MVAEICTPQDRLHVPLGYDHYPLAEDEIGELFSDLFHSAGLSQVQAAEATAYAAVAAIMNCENRGTITGLVQEGVVKQWGRDNLRGKVADAYQDSVSLAFEESRQ